MSARIALVAPEYWHTRSNSDSCDAWCQGDRPITCKYSSLDVPLLPCRSFNLWCELNIACFRLLHHPPTNCLLCALLITSTRFRNRNQLSLARLHPLTLNSALHLRKSHSLNLVRSIVTVRPASVTTLPSTNSQASLNSSLHICRCHRRIRQNL